MHVGFGHFFQNLNGARSDHEVWRTELALADRAERLGFGSVWAVEHHFTGYTMSPTPLQFLTWVAARTTRVKLGTMVCVLPWHDPLRLAEQAAVLDHVSDGRLVLGIGRGLARVEFDGFGVDMSDSRRLFVEHARTLLEAFDDGQLSRDGASVALRPAPLAPLRGRTYASSISPESQALMAELGVGIMLFLQKPWEQTVADVEAYAERFRALNGVAPPKPLIVLFAACDRDRGRARQLFGHVERYYAASTDHYEFHDPELARIPGYEYYERIATRIAKHGRGAFERFLADLQPCGTPDEVAEQIVASVRRVDAAGVIVVASYGGMTPDDAYRNQATFAEHVLPLLREIDTGDEPGRDSDGLRAHA